MGEWSAALALFLLLNMVAGLARVWRGPSRADRMLAAQLFGSTGVAILILLADATQVSALRDVALTLALLAAMAIVVFVRRVSLVDRADPQDAGALPPLDETHRGGARP